MPPSARVIPFNPGATADDLPVPIAHLRSTVHQFDELRRYAERIAVEPRWSATEWRVICSPLLIRLPSVRQSLADLDAIRVGQCADAGWAARIRTACSEVERRLAEFRLSMSALTCAEVSSTDVVVTASSDATLLATALGGLSALIASRCSAIARDRN